MLNTESQQGQAVVLDHFGGSQRREDFYEIIQRTWFSLGVGVLHLFGSVLK